jgi:hypothetical protein
MQSQLQLIQDIFSNKTNSSNNMNNIKFVYAHTMEAIALLNQKDPASNFTWNQEIAERNQRIARDLTRGLNDLISLNQHISNASNGSKPSLNGNTLDIQDKINNLGGLLEEAVSARVQKSVVNNSTNQALVLANMGNRIFYSYGSAIGFPQAKLANLVATMNMTSMSDGNMNIQRKSMVQNPNSVNNRNANIDKMPMISNIMNIQNESQYQNAQVYVKQSQEIVAKYLKSPISAARNTNANIQSQLNKILSQLKMTIDNKGSFSTVMNLVHVQLHPTLISNYGIS